MNCFHHFRPWKNIFTEDIDAALQTIRLFVYPSGSSQGPQKECQSVFLTFRYTKNDHHFD